MMSKLTKEKTSVVTILRNPIDRVFSTYEFSIEVGARFLVHPNLTSALRMTGRLRSKTKGVSTLDIWPWKYLVPWMREDLFKRRDARNRKGLTEISSNDPYNMEDVVMPLHQYINDPTAVDIIHNGATFQIAGLTNNSYLSDSHDVRTCVLKYRTLGEYVLDIAKKRLDHMLYVGLTENHKESAAMFADVIIALGFQILDLILVIMGPIAHFKSQVKETHLRRISPANFTKEARLQVPDQLLKEIESLNSLDMELYRYAQGVFLNQQRRMAQIKDAMDKAKKVSQKPERELKLSKDETSWEKPESELKSSYDATYWKVMLLSTSILLLLVFFLLFVYAKGRTSKVKL